MGRFLAIFCAIALHAIFLLFGGLIFGQATESQSKPTEVSLLSEEEQKKPEPEVQPEQKIEDVEVEEEPPPDASEIVKSFESPITNDAPALDTASLSAIEQALNGGGGGGDFSQDLSFASGGQFGGTGKRGETEEAFERAFNPDEIDQQPTVITRPAPMYPSELRKKKVEGSVTVIFFVDSTGKVSNPRVETSDNPAFDKPALDSVKQWKFEPAVKGGQRVACKMRSPIRFQPNQ